MQAAGPATLPDVSTPTVVEPEVRSAILPPWSVILHNDDHNDMLYVVRSLVRCVPKLGDNRAFSVMLEAHKRGRALVTTCPLELAELYRERLQTCGLTVTIEKV